MTNRTDFLAKHLFDKCRYRSMCPQSQGMPQRTMEPNGVGPVRQTCEGSGAVPRSEGALLDSALFSPPDCVASGPTRNRNPLAGAFRSISKSSRRRSSKEYKLREVFLRPFSNPRVCFEKLIRFEYQKIYLIF